MATRIEREDETMDLATPVANYLITATDPEGGEITPVLSLSGADAAMFTFERTMPIQRTVPGADDDLDKDALLAFIERSRTSKVPGRTSNTDNIYQVTLEASDDREQHRHAGP